MVLPVRWPGCSGSTPPEAVANEYTVCGASIDTPSQYLLAKSLTNRSCGLRVWVKPGR